MYRSSCFVSFSTTFKISPPLLFVHAVVEKEFRREAVHQFLQLGLFIGGAKVRCGHQPYVSDGILLLGRVNSFDNLLVSW